MDFKAKIKSKGLKLVWIAEQIECNYSSLKVYVNNTGLMPEWVDKKLKELLN